MDINQYTNQPSQQIPNEVSTTAVEEQKGPVTIPAQNPSQEEMKQLLENIKLNYDFSVDTKQVTFNFKKQVDKDTGVETKRESLELALPFPSMEGIVAILEAGGKQFELLQDAIESVIIAQARDIISEDVKINAANFPVDKVSWEYIANLPKAQRRGGGIPKEIWEDFVKDYNEVMPAVTGKTVEQVANASKIMANKLQQVKTNEPVLELLVSQLAIYAENSPNAEEYKECVEFLLNKADTYLNISPEELLSNL